MFVCVFAYLLIPGQKLVEVRFVVAMVITLSIPRASRHVEMSYVYGRSWFSRVLINVSFNFTFRSSFILCLSENLSLPTL